MLTDASTSTENGDEVTENRLLSYARQIAVGMVIFFLPDE